jgi:methionyl-tRNA formyltransferase
MFNTIILLTGPVEEAALTAVLRSHNPQLAILTVKSRAEIEGICPSVMQRARLIAFVTPVVVPKRVLDCLGFGAYNFHPGPPQYPGWVPSHFATYDRATTFGVTAHVMVEKVDAGPIVGVNLFSIPPNTGTLGLEALAFSHLARLFWGLARTLANQCEPLPELPIRWGARRTTRRMYAAMCEIPLDISKDELDRRVQAFGAGHFEIFPTLTLHGRQFSYTSPNVAAKAKI